MQIFYKRHLHRHSDMDMVDETPDDVLHSVCNLSLPVAVKIRDGVIDKSGEGLNGLVEAVSQ